MIALLMAALVLQSEPPTLDASVDQETLRDLLLTEPWWEPFRRAVDGFGLYADESTASVTSRHAFRD